MEEKREKDKICNIKVHSCMCTINFIMASSSIVPMLPTCSTEPWMSRHQRLVTRGGGSDWCFVNTLPTCCWWWGKEPFTVKWGITDCFALSSAAWYADLSVVTSRRWSSVCLMVCMVCTCECTVCYCLCTVYPINAHLCHTTTLLRYPACLYMCTYSWL